MVWMDQFVNYLLGEGHQGCFQVLATMNTAIMNVCV